MSDTSQGPGWWQASDGKWYPPEQAPGAAPGGPPGPPVGGPPGAPQGMPPGPPQGMPAGPPQGMGMPMAGGAPQGNLADWGTRVASGVIDFWALGILGNVVAATISSGLGNLIALAGFAFGIYNAYLNGATGRSVGKKIIGTKVISEETGQPIGAGMGIVRYFAHILDSLACFIGWFFPIWDTKRQTFADKIVKTVVITGEPKQPFGEAITSG